jgi:hypothetical protein
MVKSFKRKYFVQLESVITKNTNTYWIGGRNRPEKFLTKSYSVSSNQAISKSFMHCRSIRSWKILLHLRHHRLKHQLVVSYVSILTLHNFVLIISSIVLSFNLNSFYCFWIKHNRGKSTKNPREEIDAKEEKVERENSLDDFDERTSEEFDR